MNSLRSLVWVMLLGAITMGLLVAGSAQSVTPPAAGLLIRGGDIVDGTGAPARRADVRTSGDAIVEIGADLQPKEGERVIDATGKVVAPGFIDVHTHVDRGIEEHLEAEDQVRQGITTVVPGQCGGSLLPVSEFFGTLDRRHPAINVMTMVGHGTVRELVMGGDYKRPATAGEIELMKGLVDRAMQDGAVGLSSGLEYDPGFFAKPEELVALASVVAKYGGFYASHVRNETDTVFDAWREAIDVGRKAHVPVEISHFKLASKPVWGRAAEAVKLLEDAKREGIQVMADWYPYQYWASSIYVLLNTRNFDSRKEWEVGLDVVGGPQNVLVTRYLPDKSLNGKTIAQIAEMQGKDAVTTIMDMIRAAGPGIGIMCTSMDESDMARFFVHPQILIGSDGSLGGSHPRSAGAFPRVLARYVREKKLLPLPEAIAKMTSRTAAQVGLPDRGVVAVGKKADLVVFDPATVADRSTPLEPGLAPVGLPYVIVNGQVVLDDGKMTDARPGRAIRRQDWTPYPAR